MTRTLRIGVIGALFVTTVAVTAATASAATSPAAYAKAYCQDVQRFRIDLATRETAFHAAAAASDAAQLPAAKKDVVKFLRDGAKAAGRAADRFGDIDVPDVKDADKLGRRVVTSLRRFSSELEVLADNAAALSTTNPAAYARKAAVLDTGGFATSLRRLDAKVRALALSPALSKALGAQAACRRLF
jgi:hypothetical protein